ncbi:ABC transporter permease subunit [Mycoplasmopsis mucosicanis]|uniref:ABC transporter permease subunit n=1 Tax=Mycoplasmopsis mucosicanis TaxID=458208 RepID=A0A507SY19_9BACT|nr:ABC transporter permease subunit [Mycoplasmopsis mucosicanis]TQC54028.1 ABC transporter permease subunit [Mycoplasmopsis mucosicanis]
MNKNAFKMLRKDRILALFASIIFVFASLLFVVIFVFASLKSFKLWGTHHLFWNFSIENFNGGILLSIFYSIIVAFITLCFSIRLSLRTSIFIVFRCDGKTKHILSLIFNIFGGLPSVIFALGIYIFLTKNTHISVNSSHEYNFVFLILMFVIYNSVVLTKLLIKTLDKVEFKEKNILKQYNISTSTIIYKYILKNQRSNLLKDYFIAFVKVIGEASAVTFIMFSNKTLDVFGHNFLSSNVRTTASSITTSFFSFDSLKGSREYLFTLAFFLVVFIGFINLIIDRISKYASTNDNSLFLLTQIVKECKINKKYQRSDIRFFW